VRVGRIVGANRLVMNSETREYSMKVIRLSRQTHIQKWCCLRFAPMSRTHRRCSEKSGAPGDPRSCFSVHRR
jgi:hypothetical protein